MKPRTKSTLRYFWKHSKKYGWMIFGIFSFITVGVVLNDILIPFFYKDLVDKISGFEGDKTMIYPELIRLLIIIGGIFLFSESVGWRLSGYLNAIFQTKVIKNITDDCFNAMQHHSFDFFANNFAGSLVTKIKRMYYAFERIADVITWNVFPIFIQISFAITILYFYAPVFSLILGIWIGIYIFMSWIYSQWKLKFDMKVSTLDSKLTGELADTISNVVAIKLFARLGYECQKFFKTTSQKQKAQKNQWHLDQLFHVFGGTSMVAVEIGMMYFAIQLWIDDAITVGTIILVQSYLFSILKSLWNLGNVIRDFYRSLADAQEMTDLLNTSLGITDPRKPEKCRIQKGQIEFQNLDFAYEAKSKVFENFNLTIKSGEKIGLVGESGAGKTTITKLLLRFADPDNGQILIDGQSIHAITQDDLRRNIAFVPQEPVLFHRTLFDNIKYGNHKATEEEVYAAARKAHAHEFIKKTPQGYQTLVGERGVKLSGGERQRISVARAILKNAPILFLDEATSALDSKAEKYIQEALEKLMKHRTTIVIAHRLSTLRKMDRICVLEDGEIVELDTHENLVAQGGRYAELWSHQVGGFIH